jgi:hypothetical protein
VITPRMVTFRRAIATVIEVCRDVFLRVSSGSCVASRNVNKELVHSMSNGDGPSHTVLVTTIAELFPKEFPARSHRRRKSLLSHLLPFSKSQTFTLVTV